MRVFSSRDAIQIADQERLLIHADSVKSNDIRERTDSTKKRRVTRSFRAVQLAARFRLGLEDVRCELAAR